MPRAVTNKLYRTFVKGLITEASPLTYPPDASINEDNCVIFRKGNRTRRLGIDYELNATLSPYQASSSSFQAGLATKQFQWQAVSLIPSLYFLVSQVGLSLYFYDMSQTPLTQGLKSFVVDMTPFVTASSNPTAASQVAVDMCSGEGYMFVASSALEPFYVAYSATTDSVQASQIVITIRDHVGLSDGLANDEEPNALTPQHAYNLRNQGWLDPQQTGGGNTTTVYGTLNGVFSNAGLTADPTITYFNIIGRYPSNSKQWWLGKTTVAGADGLPGNHTYALGQFDPQLLNTFYMGNSLAPRGHYVMQAFNMDYSSVSGVSGITPVVTTNRPPTISFFSGRVWYACDSKVYYSQIVDDVRKAGFCYQNADPTSEVVSDLIASDGGYVPIPEMAQAVKLHPFGSGMMVFATNGVWFVSGSGAGFSATDIAVTKISGVGTLSPDSIVEDGHYRIYFWGVNGIWQYSHKIGAFGALNPIAIGGAFDKELISETTIQTFYNNIPANSKVNVKGAYDWATNTIQWIYRDDDTDPNFFYDRVLNLDLTLQAFYPWSVSSVLGSTPFITGIYQTPRLNPDLPDPTGFQTNVRNTFLQFMVGVPLGSNYSFITAAFNNDKFADWFTSNGVGQSYVSFVETGYEIFEDAERNKELGYVFVYLRQTETQWVLNDLNGDYTASNPSSCLFQVKWDWSSTSTANRWSTKEEAYRPRRITNPDATNLTFDSGYPIVVSKKRVRGHGTSIQFRFECDKIGFDFDLYGWAVNVTGGTAP